MRRAGRLAGVLGTGLLLLPLLGSSPAPGTHAAFNDVAPVSTGAFGSATVAPVTELTCTNSNLNRVTYSWTPQRDRSYQLQVFQGDVLRISVITSLSSVELNVGNLNLLQSGRHRVRVTALVSGTSWTAATAPESAFDAVLGLSLRCA